MKKGSDSMKDQSSHPMSGGPRRLIRLKEVLRVYPVSRTIWYEGVRAGRYPKPVRLSARTVAWWEDEVLAAAGSDRRAQ
jgi:predicted DNA-binding transcriptional regulator AlpA